MLLETAIGDAYGAAFEFGDPYFARCCNQVSGYMTRSRRGRYTDDTQMSIAIAEVMVEGLAWTKENLADRFVQAFKRDPRLGYARGFQAFLAGVRNGREFLDKILPHSDRSGSAMRAGAIGVLPSLPEVMERSAVQASLTHDTVDGVAAAQAASLMTHYFVYDLGDKADLGGFLEAYVPGDWSRPWAGYVDIKGRDCVHAAVTAVMRHDCLTAVLWQCVAFGGDVDTVAAIAMGPASCSRQVEQDLPQRLIDDLENETYGRDYLIELDRKLLGLISSKGVADEDQLRKRPSDHSA